MSYVLNLLFSKKQYTQKNDRNRQERRDSGNSLCESVSLHYYQPNLFKGEFQDLRAWCCKARSTLASAQQSIQHTHHFNYTSTPIKADPLTHTLKIQHVLKCQVEARAFSMLTRVISAMHTDKYIEINTETTIPEDWVFPPVVQVSLTSSSAEAKQGSRLREGTQGP